MPRLRAVVAALLLSASIHAQFPLLQERTDWTAPAAAWWSHVQFLADDKLEGRKPAHPATTRPSPMWRSSSSGRSESPPARRAIQQPIALVPTTVDTTKSSLVLKNPSRPPLQLGTDLTLSPHVDGSASVSAPLVFLGYGLQLPRKHIDDLPGRT